MSGLAHPPHPAGIAQAQFSHAWDVEYAQIVSRTDGLIAAIATAFQEVLERLPLNNDGEPHPPDGKITLRYDGEDRDLQRA
jgi:hypothetical protein